jgi:hypothetical protein
MLATGNVARTISDPIPKQQPPAFNRFHRIKFDSAHHDFWGRFWTVAWYVSLIGMALLGASGMTFLILHQQAFGAAVLGFALGGTSVALLEYYTQKAEDASHYRNISLIYEKQPKHVPHHIRSLSTHVEFWHNLCEENSAKAKEIRAHSENYDQAPVLYYNATREAARAKVNEAFYMALVEKPSYHGELSDLCILYERDYQSQAVTEKDARFYKDPAMRAFLVFNDHEKCSKTLEAVNSAETKSLASQFEELILQVP